MCDFFFLLPYVCHHLLPCGVFFSFPIPPCPQDPAPWMPVVALGGEAKEGKSMEAAALE